jgi:hypothetical protein
MASRLLSDEIHEAGTEPVLSSVGTAMKKGMLTQTARIASMAEAAPTTLLLLTDHPTLTM